MRNSCLCFSVWRRNGPVLFAAWTGHRPESAAGLAPRPAVEHTRRRLWHLYFRELNQPNLPIPPCAHLYPPTADCDPEILAVLRPLPSPAPSVGVIPPITEVSAPHARDSSATHPRLMEHWLSVVRRERLGEPILTDNDYPVQGGDVNHLVAEVVEHSHLWTPFRFGDDATEALRNGVRAFQRALFDSTLQRMENADPTLGSRDPEGDYKEEDLLVELWCWPKPPGRGLTALALRTLSKFNVSRFMNCFRIKCWPVNANLWSLRVARTRTHTEGSV